MIVIKLGHSSMNHQIHTLFFSEDVFCALGLEMQRSMFVPQMWQPMRWCCSLLVAIGYRLVLDRGMLREYEQGFCFEGWNHKKCKEYSGYWWIYSILDIDIDDIGFVGLQLLKDLDWKLGIKPKNLVTDLQYCKSVDSTAWSVFITYDFVRIQFQLRLETVLWTSDQGMAVSSLTVPRSLLLSQAGRHCCLVHCNCSALEWTWSSWWPTTAGGLQQHICCLVQKVRTSSAQRWCIVFSVLTRF